MTSLTRKRQFDDGRDDDEDEDDFSNDFEDDGMPRLSGKRLKDQDGRVAYKSKAQARRQKRAGSDAMDWSSERERTSHGSTQGEEVQMPRRRQSHEAVSGGRMTSMGLDGPRAHQQAKDGLMADLSSMPPEGSQLPPVDTQCPSPLPDRTMLGLGEEECYMPLVPEDQLHCATRWAGDSAMDINSQVGEEMSGPPTVFSDYGSERAAIRDHLLSEGGVQLSEARAIDRSRSGFDPPASAWESERTQTVRALQQSQWTIHDTSRSGEYDKNEGSDTESLTARPTSTRPCTPSTRTGSPAMSAGADLDGLLLNMGQFQLGSDEHDHSEGSDILSGIRHGDASAPSVLGTDTGMSSSSMHVASQESHTAYRRF